MYLSKLLLNPESEEVHRDISDCHGLHKRIMHAFPKKSDPNTGAREQFNILHRLEYNRQSHSLTLYVQSEQQPKWNFPNGYLKSTYPDESSSIMIVPFEITEQALYKGRELQFSLRANPTKKIDTKSIDGKKRNGRRVPLIKQEDLKAWFDRKAKQHGFEPIGDILVYTKTDVISKQTKGIKTVFQNGETIVHELTLQGVNFSGRLRITDPKLFVDAVKE